MRLFEPVVRKAWTPPNGEPQHAAPAQHAAPDPAVSIPLQPFGTPAAPIHSDDPIAGSLVGSEPEMHESIPELTDELVRLLNASDYIESAHRSGDGVVTATTIDKLDISVAVVAIDRSM